MQPVSAKRTEVPHSPATASAEADAQPVASHTASLGRRTLELIGNTPLLRLERLTHDLPGIQLLGKAEWYNPGGSVKAGADQTSSLRLAPAENSVPAKPCLIPPAETPASLTP